MRRVRQKEINKRIRDFESFINECIKPRQVGMSSWQRKICEEVLFSEQKPLRLARKLKALGYNTDIIVFDERISI